MKPLLWLLELLYPRKCALCRCLLEKNEADFCRKCRVSAPVFPVLEENRHPDSKRKLRFLDSVTAVWYYRENVREAVLRLKFHRAAFLAAPLGRSLAMKLLQTHPEGFDVLTWVPISPRRKRQRGYDQAALLAKTVGRELGIAPVCLLKKPRDNAAQSGLSTEEARRANVLGAYQAVKGKDLKGLRVLLIDDVFTTGVTAEECAKVLVTAGAKEVHCAVVACAKRE